MNNSPLREEDTLPQSSIAEGDWVNVDFAYAGNKQVAA
jgi:hypothetical protein